MQKFEAWMDSQQVIKEASELSKEILKLDALLTAINENRSEYHWAGCPTCTDQFQAACLLHLEKNTDFNFNGYPPIVMVIFEAVKLNEEVTNIYNKVTIQKDYDQLH